MKLVALAALIAVCGAAKLDRSYLPPSSAATAGGNHDSLQTPLTRTSERGDSAGNLPTGSFTNNFEGIVVDAAGAGTRASPDADQSGLGGPRDTYGSQNSKVGDAAFRGSLAGFRTTPSGGSGFSGQLSGVGAGQNFGALESKSERPQAFKDRNSNIISYSNDVSIDNYSYGFETDNGIAIGENGVANNGIQAQGGYSYQGDDGMVYKVTYVADEGGYRPQGDHLPTPPPIPKEILESLEQNAKDEAAGLIDDGSYDAQKYNAEGDYTHHNSGNIQYNGAQLSQFAKRPESDATASSTFINQNSQAFGKPGEFGNNGAQNTQSNLNGQINQLTNFANNQNDITRPQHQESSQVLNGQQESTSTGHQGSGHFGQSSSGQLTQFEKTQGATQSSQFGAQNGQSAPVSQFGTQSSQFISQTSQQVSTAQSAGHSPQLGFQVTQQSESTAHSNGQPGQGSASSFGVQPNRPSLGINSASNSQQNQYGNQAFKPQSYYGAAEYLPPFNANKRPSNNKPQTNEISNSQDSSKDNQSPNFIPLGQQNQGSTDGSTASSFASVNFAGVQPQTTQTVNDFQNLQPSRPNQFNSNNGQSVSFISQTSPQYSGSDAASGFSTSVKPTSIPSIELTTPLESSDSNQNLQLNAQSNLSFGNVGSLNNQAQPQSGFQNNIATNKQPTSQTLSPSFADSRPQGSSQFDSSSPAATALTTTQISATTQGKPQYSQNSQGQVQSNINYSTQKPGLSHGSDESYYYNQPSKPFGSPVARPQGSRFPSTPSYKPNGVAVSQNNQFFNQQGSQSSLNNLPNSASVAPAAPTPSSQFTQTQGSFSTNGITQASISPFPSVSPTTSSQYDTIQADRFGSKPNVPSFPSRPGGNFGQNPSTSLTHNQFQFGQTSSFNNNLPSASQSASKPITFGQTSTSSFTQSQVQFGQSATNNDQQQNPETNLEQGGISTPTQQYEGTVYEYNKPSEVLPASEQADSSSSQSVQTGSSSKPQEPNTQEAKPQSGSQQTQFGQNTFSSQQSSLNQVLKPQFGSQTFKPLGGSRPGQIGFGQYSQSMVSPQSTQEQVNALPNQFDQSISSITTQFSPNQQTGSESKPQFSSQPSKPFGSTTGTLQFGQNLQQQTIQNGVQPIKPFGGAQPTTQFGQNTQTSFGNIVQQNSGPQFSVQPNKPFGSASSSSQLGQVSQNQGSHTNGVVSTPNAQNMQTFQQSFETTGPVKGAQPAKPFGTNSFQNFQGYSSSKPQSGNQLALPQFTHTAQQTFGTSQISSQPQAPTKPFGITGSPDSVNPQLVQNTQFNQGSKQPSGSFDQQSFQTSQFGQVSKPQFGAQTQLGQNQNAQVKPFGSASSQALSGPNSAQASSSVDSQPSGIQAYKPFGSSSSSNFQSQNKPQFDQAPQSSAVSTTSAPQIGVQPFGNTQGSQSQSQGSQSHLVPCCKSINKDSAIVPLNVGKPSQAFAQTQSQFTGFQGAPGFNAQNLAGKGEEFGGPRQPPSFDAQTGYHY